ncbi:hypothetical protein EVAR_11139_1 [Eumeta japonica]|uniref:Uncharacterized protein n=1 Tax=Eumeta variegata TaxID=151549 RepID=A0A4C1U4C2_EUMVA|nr:hypothetical protein EVAR_11139_1 [Eumeta japonica]
MKIKKIGIYLKRGAFAATQRYAVSVGTASPGRIYSLKLGRTRAGAGGAAPPLDVFRSSRRTSARNTWRQKRTKSGVFTSAGPAPAAASVRRGRRRNDCTPGRRRRRRRDDRTTLPAGVRVFRYLRHGVSPSYRNITLRQIFLHIYLLQVKEKVDKYEHNSHGRVSSFPTASADRSGTGRVPPVTERAGR